MDVQPHIEWLEHASRVRACPLCTAAEQYESDYLGALSVRLVEEHDGDVCTVIHELCARHTTAFGRACRETGVSTGLLLAAHVSRLEHLAERLGVLDCESWPTAPGCAVCLARNEVVVLCAHRLLVGLLDAGGRVGDWFARAGGLCAAHFATCWQTSSDAEDREALRRAQLDAVRPLIDAARAGAAGDEFDACRADALALRATMITAG